LSRNAFAKPWGTGLSNVQMWFQALCNHVIQSFFLSDLLNLFSCVVSEILNLYSSTHQRVSLQDLMIILVNWMCSTQVLNLVIFPRPAFDLPIFCADLVTFNHMYIIVMWVICLRLHFFGSISRLYTCIICCKPNVHILSTNPEFISWKGQTLDSIASFNVYNHNLGFRV
jgi:hypothetical protein